MSNLSELLPAGGAAKEFEAVASGTLANGQTVVLNSNGTVSAISETLVSDSVGSANSLTGTSYSQTDSLIYDPDTQQVIYVYNGNSTYGTVVTGVVSGTTITFGSPVVFNSAGTNQITAAYDTDQDKVVVAYRNGGNSNYGTAIVGTVSGTSISFGTALNFQSAAVSFLTMVYNPSAQRIVVAYIVTADNQGTTRTLQVSGTSITQIGGIGYVFSSDTKNGQLVYDPVVGKAVIFYVDGSTGYSRAINTNASSAPTLGSAQTWASGLQNGEFGGIFATYDSTNQKIIAGYIANTGGYGYIRSGTLSGTTMTYDSNTTQATSVAIYKHARLGYDPSAQRAVLFYSNGASSNRGEAISIGLTGTTFDFNSAVTVTTNETEWPNITYDPTTEKTILVGDNYVASPYSFFQSWVFTTSYFLSNNTDFIGITQEAIADTATGLVTPQGGVNSSVTGLTIGADYYVQDGGSLASDSIPFDISSASYDSVSFSVASQDITPQGLAFNTDGTKMFVVGKTGDSVYEYTLSTGFDVSTSSYSQSFSVSAQELNPTDITFNTNGTKMFVVGLSGDAVNEYTLSTGFDVSTASYSQSFSVASQETQPTGLAFNTDGTKMFIAGPTFSVSVNEYTLSTGFDVSTASFVDGFSVDPQDGSPEGIAFNTTGTKMFILGASNDAVFEYTLSTAFDVSTASYASVSFSVASQETSATGLEFNPNGTKMFIIGESGDDVNQYSTSPASTTVFAGRALSTTSILLEG